jgi:hypothetical protein
MNYSLRCFEVYIYYKPVLVNTKSSSVLDPGTFTHPVLLTNILLHDARYVTRCVHVIINEILCRAWHPQKFPVPEN